ncbi:MAG TPA: vWA domain-containing protein, partial [Pirellulaceae bacterium]|nr:vWA domain-containing protein [Pirellulaceae bacterium]
MTNWYTQPVFGSHLAVALVAIVLLALLWIGPAYRKLSWRQRSLLLTLRMVVIGLLLIALLRPARVSTTTRPQTGVMMVLADRSRSMQLSSGDTSRSRYEAQRDALNAASDALSEVAQQFDVRLYTYDSKLTPLDFANGKIAWPEKPDGRETDIGTALADATRRELGRRILGVVLLGDGVQTALEPRVETQEAARELGRLGVPLYTSVFGPVGDAAQARDVAMEYLQDQYTVFVKNEVVIKGLMRITGYANQEIPVELILEDANGKREKLGPQQIMAKVDGQQVEVAFPYTPTKAGQYKLTLRAAPQQGELVTKNNELQSFLNVLDGG